MSERSGKYNFYKPSRDGNDIADINEITTNFTIIDGEIPSNADLTTTVENAKAELNERISSVDLTATTAAGLATSKGTWVTIADTTITQSVSKYNITTGGNYKKLLIRIEMTEDTSGATGLGRVQLAIGNQTVWTDGSAWIGKTKSGSSILNGTSNPKVIIFDIDVADNYTMIWVRGEWVRATISAVGLFPTSILNENGIGVGWKDWGISSVALNSGVTTNKITLYFPAASYPLFAGSRVIVKGVMA